MSVNLSPREFRQAGLVEQIASALRGTGLSPETLILELTESGVMEDIAGAVETLTALKRLGVRVAIDDFGKGHSSLSYLKSLPVDIIKIDKSFVEGLGNDARDETLVRAIISLARELDLLSIAEGVETADQMTVLRAMRCDRAQGYHFSPPVTSDVFEELYWPEERLDIVA